MKNKINMIVRTCIEMLKIGLIYVSYKHFIDEVRKVNDLKSYTVCDLSSYL